jgi:AraC-like DNA-binding protein
METDDTIHFGGDWRKAEREVVEEAVTASDGETNAGRSPPGIEGPDSASIDPWVCLRVRLDGGPYFLGYQLGGDDILKAQSASELAVKIGGELGNGSDEPEWRGGIPLYRLRKVIDFVRSHLDRRITVAQMAEQAGMSKFHFAREFRRSLGLTPLQYVTQCRIEKAKGLLRGTGLKIEEVARQCGYQSGSHFAEVFQKSVGVRPREYRLAREG